MPRIDRKIKREIARSLKARSLREKKLEAYNLERGVHAGILIQKAKVNNATLGMRYLYEYPVETTDTPIVDIPNGVAVSSLADPRYDYPDADAIPS